MRVLTVENNVFKLTEASNEIEDIRYCVLDVTDPTYVDYFFIPLIFLETFTSPALVLQIGDFKISMPLDWSVLIGEPEQGILELMPLANLNDRGFKTLLYNPLKGFMPIWRTVEIVNVYTEVKWDFPKLKVGHILTMPLEDKHNPLCAFFVKEINKIPAGIDIGDLIL